MITVQGRRPHRSSHSPTASSTGILLCLMISIAALAHLPEPATAKFSLGRKIKNIVQALGPNKHDDTTDAANGETFHSLITNVQDSLNKLKKFAKLHPLDDDEAISVAEEAVVETSYPSHPPPSKRVAPARPPAPVRPPLPTPNNAAAAAAAASSPNSHNIPPAPPLPPNMMFNKADDNADQPKSHPNVPPPPPPLPPMTTNNAASERKPAEAGHPNDLMAQINAGRDEGFRLKHVAVTSSNAAMTKSAVNPNNQHNDLLSEIRARAEASNKGLKQTAPPEESARKKQTPPRTTENAVSLVEQMKEAMAKRRMDMQPESEYDDDESLSTFDD